jgi:uncharacterized protein (TIGR02646 family)
MIFIDISKLNIDNTWNAKSLALTSDMILNLASVRTIFTIIDTNDNHWGKIKNELKKKSYGKCWFSESREVYSHYHIEHFRPKKKVINFDNSKRVGYWWLAFNYLNYRLCGSVGNSKKGNYFAVKRNSALTHTDSIDDEVIYFLDPTNIRDCVLLSFDEDGKAFSRNTNNNSFDYERVNYTIEHLDLNYESLKTARKVKWKETYNLIIEIDKLIIDYNANQSITNKIKLEEKYNSILKNIAPCAEFSSTVKSCLKASGRDWAIDILGVNIEVKDYCNDYIINEDDN